VRCIIGAVDKTSSSFSAHGEIGNFIIIIINYFIIIIINYFIIIIINYFNVRSKADIA